MACQDCQCRLMAAPGLPRGPVVSPASLEGLERPEQAIGGSFISAPRLFYFLLVFWTSGLDGFSICGRAKGRGRFKLEA